MSDSLEPNIEQQMDDCLEGKLNAAAARALAQQALDRPDLFDELTDSAFVKAALDTDLVKHRLESVAPNTDAKIAAFPRRVRQIAAAGALAATIALVTFYSLRSWPRNSAGTASQTARRNLPAGADAPKRPIKPTLNFAADPGQPVLLASLLRPDQAHLGPAPIFRGPARADRLPRRQGSILSLDEGIPTVDLGSLDGLAKGTELSVFGGDTSSRQIGRLVVTTVFRDRARARITAGAENIATRDKVRASPEVYLTALLEQAESRSFARDLTAARGLAEKAVDFAAAHDVPLGGKRKALETLAALEYASGELEPARKHYETAVNGFGAAPAAGASEQAAVLNTLGSLYLLRGDYGNAETSLKAAATALNRGQEYGRTLNNLGALAELRGQSREAKALYDNARRAFENDKNSSARDLHALEMNLARVQTNK